MQKLTIPEQMIILNTMPGNNNQKGIVSFLSIAVLGFLTLALIVGTSAVSNKNFNFDPRTWAENLGFIPRPTKYPSPKTPVPTRTPYPFLDKCIIGTCCSNNRGCISVLGRSVCAGKPCIKPSPTPTPFRPTPSPVYR